MLKKKLNHKVLILSLFFGYCSINTIADSDIKINNCIELADEIEKIFDVIQIEAYESEIYKTYSYVDATKLDYVYEALRINKIGLNGLDSILANYEINNSDLQSLIDGFYGNFEDSKNANTALEQHLVSIGNNWTIQDEVQWWEENQEYGGHLGPNLGLSWAIVEHLVAILGHLGAQDGFSHDSRWTQVGTKVASKSKAFGR